MTDRPPDPTLDDIKKAASLLMPVLEKTPMTKASTLSDETRTVFLKLDNLQVTGSFKVRGAFNKVATLSDAEREKGIIAASAGNHAQGVALGGQRFKAHTVIVMPETTPRKKIVNTEQYGAKVELFGQVYDDAYKYAREQQVKRGMTFVHPFDDDVVITGQGTVGLEIMEQVPDLDCIVVPIGGGGLICGVAIAAKAINPNITIIGVQASGADAMYKSFQKKERITNDHASTIADGIQVREPGVRTFELIMKYVDQIVTVEEKDIHHAILYLIEKYRAVSEGAGAVPLAAFQAGKIPTSMKKICLLISGGNIDVEKVSRLIDRGLLLQDRRFRFETQVDDTPGSLGKLCQHLAAVKANILTIQQTRTKHSIGVMIQMVDVTVELTGSDHKEELVKYLQDHKYVVTPL
jgi:threonine dehydratase